MKTRITLHLRPLLRAFYPLLFAIAALWAMPRNAHAQLYVTSDVVSKYNATTGEVINASFNSQLYALWRAVPKVAT